MAITYINIHSIEDGDRFPAMCNSYDENDVGYTMGCTEVFVDRLEEWASEAIASGEEDEALALNKEIVELKKCEDRIELIN